MNSQPPPDEPPPPYEFAAGESATQPNATPQNPQPNIPSSTRPSSKPANTHPAGPSGPPPAGHYHHRPPPPRPQQYPTAAPRQATTPTRGLSTKQRLANKIKNAAKERDVLLSSSKISVGDVFSVDAHSGNLKFGRLSLSDKGATYDGRPIGPQVPPHMMPHRHGYPHYPHQHGGSYGGPQYGGGPQGYPAAHAGGSHYHRGPMNTPPPPHGYGPPRHTGSWDSASPPMPPRPGAYGPPQHSQTWNSGQASYGSPHGGASQGYGPPPPHRGSRTSYSTHPNDSPYGQTSGHQEQTSGTTG